MSMGDNTQATPIGQGQNDQIAILNNLVHSLLQLMGPAAPAIIPGALYLGTQVERNLNIGDKTLSWWKDNGLESHRPATRSDYYLGSDIINFVVTHDDLPSIPTDYKERMTQRKKGRGK